MLGLPCLFLLSACEPDFTTSAPPTEVVQAGMRVLSVEAQGEVRAAKATPLNVPGSQWAGRQLVWMVEEGSVVRAGDVIARFTAYESELKLSQAQIDLLRAALERSAKQRELDANETRVDADLAQVAVDLGIAERYADADLDMFARNTVLDAVQDVELLTVRELFLSWQQGQLEQRGAAEFEVLSSKDASLELRIQTSRADLEALELRAPNDGILMLSADWGGEKPRLGSNLRAGMEFGSLPDTRDLLIQLSVPQSETSGIMVGDPVEIHPLGRPDLSFSASISWVASAAQPRSRQNPVRYLQMRVPVPADQVEPLGLIPGRSVQARITTLSDPDVLTIPNVALMSDNGVDYVLLLRNGQFERQTVKLGRRGLARVEVLEGLQAGDEVLLIPAEQGASPS